MATKETKLSDYTQTPLSEMSICRIAEIIRKDWITKSPTGVNYAAKPYLDAMRSIDNINDPYIVETGRDMVMYFLSNASSWRGEVAKAIKLHLNNLIKK